MPIVRWRNAIALIPAFLILATNAGASLDFVVFSAPNPLEVVEGQSDTVIWGVTNLSTGPVFIDPSSFKTTCNVPAAHPDPGDFITCGALKVFVGGSTTPLDLTLKTFDLGSSDFSVEQPFTTDTADPGPKDDGHNTVVLSFSAATSVSGGSLVNPVSEGGTVSVNVSDIPEPSFVWPVGFGLLLVGLLSFRNSPKTAFRS